MDIFQISISCAIFEIHLHIKNHSLFIWNTNVTRSLIFLLNQATLPPAHDYSYSSILFIVLCLSTVGTRGKPYALNFSFSYSQQLPLNFILLLFSPSVVSDSLWPHGLQNARLPLPFTISQSFLKLMSIESVMPSNHLILCCPFLLLLSIFPSISLFQWVGSSHQVAKVLELQLQHQSFQWILRVDFL